MTDRRWAEVWKVYCDLRETSGGTRSAALLSLPDGVREEVQELLDQSDVVSQLSHAMPAKRAPEYQPGTEIGRYVITGLIGEGGFGRVYSAHDKDLRRSVAIKILSAEGGGKGKGVVEEARLASALNHPNILTIHETVEIGGHPAMVMEFVPGRSLRRELAESKGPLPLGAAIGYATQIAQALGAAHSAGIVHRDVKPENILVRPDGYLKLVDFGLASARIAADVLSWQPFHGTLRYTSPEQLKGAASSPSSDIFALGLVLYEMVTGVHPFRKTTPLETAGAIASVKPLPPNRQAKGIPVELNQLILSMLEKDPALRPSATAVLEVLTNVSGRPAGKARKWMAAAVVVAAAAGAAAWIGSRTTTMAIQLATVPLTGSEGREREPAISSDGRFVVYEWQPRVGAPFKTLVREIGTEATRELPIEPPFAWVPGTERISFRRHTGASYSLHTISRQGGPIEPVFSINREFTLMQWSPDRRFIVYLSSEGDERRGALFLYTLATGKHQQLVFPNADQFDEGPFAISPDGNQLAFRRHTKALNSDIYLTDFPRPGNLRRLTFLDSPGGDNVAWLRDGSGLVSSAFLGADYSLWLHPVVRPAPATRLTSLGVQVWGLSGALSVNRLAWQNAYDDANIWRVATAGGQAERVIASPMRDADVAVSSAGMLAFRSDRSGFPELWLAGPGGSAQKRITIGGQGGSPRWASDGLRLVFDARFNGRLGDVFVADCDPDAIRCGAARQLTDDPAPDVLPNWSRDGNFVYFTSRRSGRWQLWRVPATGTGRPAEQVTSAGGFYAAESNDRQWLYYSRTEPAEAVGVWRKRLGSKLPFDSPGEMVLAMEERSIDTWELIGNEIYYQFIDSRLPGSIEAFDLRTRRKRMVFDAGAAPIARGLSVSPDGKWAYFARTDRSESNVVYADYQVLK